LSGEIRDQARRQRGTGTDLVLSHRLVSLASCNARSHALCFAGITSESRALAASAERWPAAGEGLFWRYTVGRRYTEGIECSASVLQKKNPINSIGW
jgi:hypothetical protein